jgi:SAM-dependent methyltransferase
MSFWRLLLPASGHRHNGAAHIRSQFTRYGGQRHRSRVTPFHNSGPGSITSVGVGVYVQYGSGEVAPVEWLNFDASFRLRMERLPGIRLGMRLVVGLLYAPNIRVGDIVCGLPLPDAAATGIYCSHVLEHIPRDDLPAALRNTLRLLRPGGRFRLIVPDLEWRVARYAAASARRAPSAADDLMRACLLGQFSRNRTIVDAAKGWLGKSRHLWMYDFAALQSLLDAAGFRDIRRCDIGDCDDPMFALVEDVSRFYEGAERELAIEARAP